MTTPQSTIEQVAAIVDFGTPSARKGGRNPQFPYVPILRHDPPVMNVQTTQLKGYAYATREEAIAHAERHVERARQSLARRLAEPRNRLLREQYGLPREIAR